LDSFEYLRDCAKNLDVCRSKLSSFVFLHFSFFSALKSDNANGLFGFKQRCEPEVVKENGSTTCYISRARGIDGEVTVFWQAGTGDLQSENDEDFVQSAGDVTFLAGETEKVHMIIDSSVTEPAYSYFSTTQFFQMKRKCRSSVVW